LDHSLVPTAEHLRSQGRNPPLNLQLPLTPLDAHIGTAGHEQVDVRLVIEPALPDRRPDTEVLGKGRCRLKPTLQGGMVLDLAFEEPAHLVTGQGDSLRHGKILPSGLASLLCSATSTAIMPSNHGDSVGTKVRRMEVSKCLGHNRVSCTSSQRWA